MRGRVCQHKERHMDGTWDGPEAGTSLVGLRASEESGMAASGKDSGGDGSRQPRVVLPSGHWAPFPSAELTP